MKAKLITVEYSDRIIILNGQQADIVMKKITNSGLRGMKAANGQSSTEKPI